MAFFLTKYKGDEMQKSIMKLTKTTILLHWLVGITIITLISVGMYMEQNEAWSLYPLHKSFGVIVFVIILYRIYRRIKRGWLQPVRNFTSWELMLSKVVHWLLIIGTLLFPVSGMLMSIAGGHGVSVFGIDILASNHDVEGNTIALNKTLAGLGHEIHEILGVVMIVLIVIHILAAFKHHYFDNDKTLLRMLGK